MADKTKEVELAKAVLAAAKEHGMLDGPVPRDEDKKKEKASEIVDQARAAYEAGVRGDHVMAVLYAAEALEDDGSSKKADEPTRSGIDELIDDYDDLKVADILEIFESGKLTPDQIREVQAYEKKDGERAKIMNFEPPEPEPEDDPKPEKVEGEFPIDDYDDKSAKEIIEIFESGDLTRTQVEMVIAFESKNDERARILKFDLDTVPEAKDDDPAPEPDPEPDDEPAFEPDPDFDPESVIDDYDKRRAPTVLKAVEELTDVSTLRNLRVYEADNKEREKILEAIDERIGELGDEPADGPASDGHKELDDAADDAVAKDDEREARDPAPIAPKRKAILESGEHRERVLAEIRKAGIEPPEEPDRDMPELPTKIAELSDDQLNQLMVDFTAYHAIATYRLALAQIDHDHFKRVADHHARVAMREIGKIDPETEKPKTVPQLEAETESHEEVSKWRELQEEAGDEVIAFRGQKEITKGGYDVLSRILSYRIEERERATARR